LVAILLQQELDHSCVLYAQTNAVVYDKPLAQSLALAPLLKRNSLLFSRQNFSQLSHLVTGECALSCSGNNRTSLCTIMGKCNVAIITAATTSAISRDLQQRGGQVIDDDARGGRDGGDVKPALSVS
jgi:hypothetical protein